MTFQEFNFKAGINKALEDAGFKEPSPIQEQGIPVVMTGVDVVAQAQTGTGKTAAFALPMLERLRVDGSIEALVIVPTRELAMQVSDEIFKFGKHIGARTATVYGGSSYNRQLDMISRASIIIATPGRLIDLLSSGKIKIKPDFVVLDEADEMLDMGFLEPIKEIFEMIGTNRQTMMFSATMPEEIKRLAKQILKTPEFVSVASKNITNDNIKQQYYVVNDYERDEALVRLLDYYEPTKAIIFCRMKKEVDRLLDFLASLGFSIKGLHGDMDQRERENVMRAFKGNGAEILVATDVAARGLDVNDVTHVFNYHLPFDSESYVHRIGRTGRAGKKGTAISLLSPAEFKSLKSIQRATKDSLVNEIIPVIDDVRSKKVGSFIDKVKEAKVNDKLAPIIEELKREFTDEDLIEKLVSLLQSDVEVRGNNIIGKSKQEVSHLIKNFREDRGGGRGGRGGYRGGNRSGGRGGYRGNGGNRNSSGGGYRGNGGGRSSSGGGYRGSRD